MSELKPCPFCGAEAVKKHISAKCSRNCVDWTYVQVWNSRQPHPAIKAVYDQNRSLFVICEAMRNPNKPENRLLFKLWTAIKEAVEECED